MEKKYKYEKLDRIAKFVYAMGIELWYGIRAGSIPATMSYGGLAAGIAVYFYTSGMSPNVRTTITSLVLLSGWIVWSMHKAGERERLLKKLKDAFIAAKLSCNDRFPALIEDVEIDQYVRRLRLHTNGVTEKEFEGAIEKIQSILNFTVVRLLQSRDDRSKIEIIYTVKDLPREVYLESPDRFADAEIPIGLSYSGGIHMNLRDIGHMLVSGQTGGGKSNYLKLVASVLAGNNPGAEIIYLDFKGGMESADLRQALVNQGGNVRYLDGAQASIKELSDESEIFDTRLKEFGSFGVVDFDDYKKKRDAAKKIGGTSAILGKAYKRKFYIVDEIAQLYTKAPPKEKEETEKARALVNRISRQGRAAGVHLIVATQKPDSSGFDQTVKANLPAILCFPMANQASSVAALGNKRAYEIDPSIKGRAIWKYGPNMEEVQTYYFT